MRTLAAVTADSRPRSTRSDALDAGIAHVASLGAATEAPIPADEDESDPWTAVDPPEPLPHIRIDVSRLLITEFHEYVVKSMDELGMCGAARKLSSFMSGCEHR